MKKFIAVYKAPAEEMQKMITSMTPETRKTSMEEWMKWMTAHKADIADDGAPFGKTKQVTASGIADIRNDLGGYTIVSAETHEEAAKFFSDNPHLKMAPSASIEIMEIVTMPGM